MTLLSASAKIPRSLITLFIAALISVAMAGSAQSAGAATITPHSTQISNIPMRDSCGGANGNIAYSGDQMSFWGIVWENTSPATCKKQVQTVTYAYYMSNGQYVSPSWSVSSAPGPGKGFDTGTITTASHDAIVEIEVTSCDTNLICETIGYDT